MRKIKLHVTETIEYTVTREVTDDFELLDEDGFYREVDDEMVTEALLLNGEDLAGPVLAASVAHRSIEAWEV